MTTSSGFTFREAMVVVAVSGVTTLNVFLQGALTVALPTIGKDLEFKQSDLQWPVNVYALSFGCLLLFFGRLGDIVGGKKMFLAGTTWFATWSIPTAFAPKPYVFIIFMTMKGLGAAANTPAAVSLLTSTFPPGPKRNKAIAALGAGQPIGFIIGLILGGILTDSSATWRTIFFMQAGLGFIFAVLGYFVLESDSQNTGRRYTKGLDWGGAILSTAGVGMLTYSVADSTTAAKGWATPHIPSLLSVSIVILCAFIYYERWREARDLSVLVPLGIFRQKGSMIGSIIAVVFFAWWSFNTLSYFATLYFQQVNLYNALETSLRFIPMTISGFIVNVVTGYLLGMVPGFWLIMIGLSGGIVAPLIFALINVNASYWASAFLVLIIVVLVDTVYVVGNIQITASVGGDTQAVAGGLFNVAGRLGTALGLAVSSSIASSTSTKYHAAHASLEADSPEVLMVGFRAAGWTCFAAGVISFVIAVITLRGIGRVQTSNEKPIEVGAVAGVGGPAIELAALERATTNRSELASDMESTNRDNKAAV